MNRYFTINDCSNIILYGAASIGLIAKEMFENKGYKISGFIDKRADEIKNFLNLPVWTIDSVPIEFERKNTLVFIAVKNVFEHDEIVELLLEAGLCNIIYKPYGVLYDYATDNEKSISQVYDMIINGKLNKSFDEKIPISFKMSDKLLKNFSIVYEDESTVIAYIPVEFIYTNNYTDKNMKKWGNINILAFFTHLQFFRYLAGDRNASPSYYLNEYCVYTARIRNAIDITEDWKKNVLRNRAVIYEQMNMSLEIDPDFFIRSAPEAEWNEKGYFNLTSGKHRSSFLVSRGYRHIPLKISSKDYYQYVNKTNAECAYRYFSKMKLARNSFPIPSPFFYRYHCIGRELYYGLIERYSCMIAKEIYTMKGSVDFRKVRILDLISNNNMVGRFFAKMGCNVFCLRNGDVDSILDELLCTKGLIQYFDEIPSVSYDIVFCDERLIPGIIETVKNVKTRKLVLIGYTGRQKEYAGRLGSLRIVFSAMTDKGFVDVYEQ